MSRQSLKMEGVTKNHILSVLACTLRICIERDPAIRTICKYMKKSNLKTLPKEVLLKKIKSVLLHCSIKTINYLFKKGLFDNNYILSMVVNIINIRNLQENPDSSEILSHHRK